MTEPSPRARLVAALFDRVAPAYEQVGPPWFAPIGAALVREVAPAPGERAVDLGCGRGAALFPLAAAVGPGGRVTGVDLSAQMVALTEAEVRERGLNAVDLHVMDASAPDLPAGAYDVATSSLVLFFLPDPAAAVSNWRRLLVPGGRLGVSTFGTRDPVWHELDALFRPYLPPQLLDARTSGESGPFGSDEGMERLLAAAGFGGVRTAGLDVRVTFDDREQWRDWSRSHGQRAMWDAVPAQEQPRLLDAAAGLLEATRDAGGRIGMTQRVRLTTATA
jgi:ubiquinone/menaquinone biosynthesis C-methylase UbiE